MPGQLGIEDAMKLTNFDRAASRAEVEAKIVEYSHAILSNYAYELEPPMTIGGQYIDEDLTSLSLSKCDAIMKETEHARGDLFLVRAAQQVADGMKAKADELAWSMGGRAHLRALCEFELGRRARVELIKAKLDKPCPLLHRYLYGPSTKHLLCRMNTGKQVRLMALSFDVPQEYQKSVQEHIKARGFKDIWYNSCYYDSGGSSVVVYELGFEPRKTILVQFVTSHMHKQVDMDKVTPLE